VSDEGAGASAPSQNDGNKRRNLAAWLGFYAAIFGSIVTLTVALINNHGSSEKIAIQPVPTAIATQVPTKSVTPIPTPTESMTKQVTTGTPISTPNPAPIESPNHNHRKGK